MIGNDWAPKVKWFTALANSSQIGLIEFKGRLRHMNLSHRLQVRIPSLEGWLAWEGQFNIAADRSADEAAKLIEKLGYEPVWKDWDAVLTT